VVANAVNALLHKASLMVNNLLSHPSTVDAFNNLVQYETSLEKNSIANNFQQLSLQFDDLGRSKIVATHRDLANFTNTTIFIHSDLLIRHTNSTDPQEKKFIEVFTSVCIIHERGHLIERWKGFRLSKDDKKLGVQEAGQVFEEQIFGGAIRMVLKKLTDNTTKFSRDTPVTRLILQTSSQKLELEAAQFDGWDQAGFSTFFPLKRVQAYKQLKGFVLAAFKKCDEPYDGSAVYRTRKDEVIADRGHCTFED
jgi:hypothetical protein